MKLPMFHGNGIDDPEQYQFLCEAFWTTIKTNDENVKKGQLATTLWGRALDWYMRFIQVLQGIATKTLDDIWKGILEEFKKPKSRSLYIIELKEIK